MFITCTSIHFQKSMHRLSIRQHHRCSVYLCLPRSKISSLARYNPQPGYRRQCGYVTASFEASHSSSKSQSPFRWTFISVALVGALAIYAWSYKRLRIGIARILRSASTVGAIAIDYKWSLRHGPDTIGREVYEAEKSAFHQRSADRLLELCKQNGGIFVKLVRLS